MKKMKIRISAMILAAAAATLAGGERAHAMAKAPTESGNYCTDEAKQWLQNRFKDETSDGNFNVVFYWKPEYGQTNGMMWVKSSLCSGEFVLSFFVDHDGCTTPVYGTPMKRLTQVYATGECQKYMPQPEIVHY